MKSWKIYLLLLFMIMGNFEVFGQNDTLIMINGEILTGEIKLFDNGVVTIETMYSDNDFEVEWEKVEQISTIRQFVVIMTDGNRYFGTLTSERRSIHCSN